MKSIPSYIQRYLWDIKDSSISKKNTAFIIERILEYGDEKAIQWLNKMFKKEIIVEVLKKSKKISTKTGNFFALYYDIRKEEMQCFRKPYTRKQDRF